MHELQEKLAASAQREETLRSEKDGLHSELATAQAKHDAMRIDQQSQASEIARMQGEICRMTAQADEAVRVRASEAEASARASAQKDVLSQEVVLLKQQQTEASGRLKQLSDALGLADEREKTYVQRFKSKQVVRFSGSFSFAFDFAVR